MRVEPTVDEIVATLVRSKLPTVLTEGTHDAIIFRGMEDRLSDLGVSFLPVGGRDKLLSVFLRRNEYATTPTVFVTDQDLWVLSSIPIPFQHPEICTTIGYSIENDMYSDGNLHSLLVGSEVSSFASELAQVCDWFANAAYLSLSGKKQKLDHHPMVLLDAAGRLNPQFAAMPAAPSPFRANIQTNFAVVMRGKTLLAVLLRQLARPSRTPAHRPLQLLEMAASRNGPHLQRIENFIRSKLAASPPPSPLPPHAPPATP